MNARYRLRFDCLLIKYKSSLFKTEIVSWRFLFLVKNRVELIDSGSEVSYVSSECDFEHAQELIHTFQKALWRVGHTLDSWFSFINYDLIGQISWHDEIVLNNEGALLVVQDESFQHFGSNNSLLTIQICRGLIDQVSISTLRQGQNNGDSLKLSSWEFLNLVVNNVIKLHGPCNFWNKGCCHPWISTFLKEQFSHSALKFRSNCLRLVTNVHFRNLHYNKVLLQDFIFHFLFRPFSSYQLQPAF